MIDIRPASAFSLGELTALWTAAYEGYFVPLAFEEAMVARHVRRSAIKLDGSLVALVDGEAAGMSLAGFRGDRAWIGGFGVVAGHRRKGVARDLIVAHVGLLDAAGVAETVLEVIDINPAREVYRHAGFEETRRLMLFEGGVQAGANQGDDLSLSELEWAHKALNPARPTWRREWPTVLDGLGEGATAIGIERVGALAAYAVAFPHGERLVLFDAAAASEGAGADLLRALAARWPGLSIRLVDEPEGTPLALGAARAGLTSDLGQVEMRRRRP